MRHWIAYARTGRELEVKGDLQDLGIEAEVALKVEGIRRGNRRFPDAVVSAMFPNYVIITCTDDDWHKVQTVRHLARSMMEISARVYERELRPCYDRVERETAKRMAEIAAGNRISEYKPGDMLEIMGGNLAGLTAVFRGLIERTHEHQFPVIQAEMKIFGRDTPIRIDPINARRA